MAQPSIAVWLIGDAATDNVADRCATVDKVERCHA